MTDQWSCPHCAEWKQRAECAEARASVAEARAKRLESALHLIVSYPDTTPAPAYTRIFNRELLTLAQGLLNQIAANPDQP
jgi:hypothetical protein